MEESIAEEIARVTGTVMKQMNSDIFDGVERANYKLNSFTEMEVKQAKESFIYNGYKIFESDNILSVKISK